ncbi:hypothetical protein CC86DRAFT_137021 [Ophiobolus disseminans]|uniref:Uncharacterized protein n=1 Tax=Ophiobolus disseminans TaxID=1469910 RepID=A0A6A7AEE5_9PLEO|nr:hypothetical protein CC86DRAFT_137021 [Ophiobolus disseminans]
MIEEHLIEKVLLQAKNTARHSWESGTVFEALLGYHDPSLSVFNHPFPIGQIPILDENEVEALKYVKPFILTDGDTLCEGNGTLQNLLAVKVGYTKENVRRIARSKKHQQLDWQHHWHPMVCSMV